METKRRSNKGQGKKRASRKKAVGRKAPPLNPQAAARRGRGKPADVPGDAAARSTAPSPKLSDRATTPDEIKEATKKEKKLSLTEISKITGITRKTLQRYSVRKGPHRQFARRWPGERRVHWTPGVIPVFRKYYKEGTASGRYRKPKHAGPPRW